MGFMTEVSILNDRWDEICEKPKEFVEQIYLSSTSDGREPQWIIGQTTVAKTHHADDLRVYYASGNSFFDAYPDRNESVDKLKRHLKFLKEMKNYISHAEKTTNSLIAKSEEIKNA